MGGKDISTTMTTCVRRIPTSSSTSRFLFSCPPLNLVGPAKARRRDWRRPEREGENKTGGRMDTDKQDVGVGGGLD